MTPRLIQDLHESFSSNVGQDRREKINYFRKIYKFPKRNYNIGPIRDRSGKVWLGSSGILNFRPSIVSGLTWECC